MGIGKRPLVLITICVSIGAGLVFPAAHIAAVTCRDAGQAKGDFESLTTDDAFLRALLSAGAPGGIVRKINCSGAPDRRQPFPLPLSLQKMLEFIRKTDPQYRVRIEKGIVNLLPTGREPELLKVRIKEYRAEKVSTPNLALEKLLGLP